MNRNHLAIFYAVAEEMSISRGAARLMVSQPAVSKQLGQFERSLGVRLLDRLPRGVRLTQAGELLLTYARRIAAAEAEAQQALDELKGLRRGRLRIGASTTLGVYLLPDAFVRFRTRYPAIAMTLELARSSDIEQRLTDGRLELGFTEAFSGTTDLEAEVLMNDQLVAIVSPRHPLARKRRVTAEQFCREPFVVRDTGSDTRSFVEQHLAAKGLSVRPVMSLGSTEAIKRAVAAGVGVAIVSRLSIELELKARRLVVLPVTGLSISRPLYCLRPLGGGGVAAESFVKLVGLK